MPECFGRRRFLKSTLATAAAVGAAKAVNLGPLSKLYAGQPEAAPMPTRRLGKTDFQVRIFSLGGQSTVEQEGRQEEAVEIIHRALDLGVNYIDTAHVYGEGVSEGYIGEVMKDRREEVFLATKSHDPTYDGTMRLCEESLERLQTDYLDLYQHHYVHRDDQLQQILGSDGAVRAFERLQEEGVIKHKGITSHSSRILLRALEQYDYDCALITLNPVNASMTDREYLDAFFAKAAEKDVGVIGMKVTGRGRIFDTGLTMQQLLTYTLSFPVATAIVGITVVEQLDENVAIARDFQPLSEEARAAMERHAAT